MHPVLNDLRNDKTTVHFSKSIFETYQPVEIVDAITTFFFYHLYHGADIPTVMKINQKRNPHDSILNFCHEFAKKEAEEGHSDFATSMNGCVCQYQLAYQIHEWMKTKQTYRFDSDILSELARTNTTICIPHNIYSRLPYDTLYLDFSANSDITKEIGFDGALITVQSFGSTDGKEYYLFMMTLYKDGNSAFFRTNVTENCKDTQEKTLGELMKDTINHCTADNMDMNMQTALLIQAMLYLCSYEPDIRETPASKMQHKKVKQDRKKGSKAELPVREFKVGERFGEAFRKWTKGSIGQGSSSTGTGRHMKPHIRRAHWHRFWVGKRDSDERRLVIKWLSECFCGVAEHEAENKLDVVSHEVKGESSS